VHRHLVMFASLISYFCGPPISIGLLQQRVPRKAQTSERSFQQISQFVWPQRT